MFAPHNITITTYTEMVYSDLQWRGILRWCPAFHPDEPINVDARSDYLDVLACYPGEFRSEQIELLGAAGGFSGARIWRIRMPDRTLCLKCWPSGDLTEEALQFIHAVVLHVRRQGLDIVPTACQDRLGRTVVRHQDHLWDLTPWLPGRADYRQNPLPAKLDAALKVLAELHRAAESYPGRTPHVGRSPGVVQRLQRVRRYAAGEWSRLFRSVVPDVWPEFYDLVREALLKASEGLGPLEILLETASTWEVPLQVCIRDVWHDHVLFTGERVTGLVDFGALGIESVAADVARLLGSMASVRASRTDADAVWQAGLAAYASIRPMQDHEKALVEVFDRSGALLGALNWIEWLFGERRQFCDPAAVAQRLDVALRCLRDFGSETRTPGRARATSGLWTP